MAASVEGEEERGEDARLAALRSYSILDSLPEQEYDDLTAMASYICDTPISLVSLVDADRQWFKSSLGLPVPETPRSQSFCAHAIPARQTLIVSDAAEDPRFRENPLVTGDPGIRFYAGAPLFDRQGHVLGTVCVIDTKPRSLDPRQIATLEALARQVTHLLELRRAADEQRAAAARLALAAEAAELGMFTWEADGGRVHWENDRLYAIFRRPRELGPLDAARFAEAAIHPNHAPSFAAAIERSFSMCGRLFWQGRIRRHDGSEGWIEITGQAECGADGKARRLFGAAADITARKEAEAALRTAEEHTRLAHGAARIAAWEWNPETGSVVWNGDTRPIYGREAGELAGLDQWLQCVHGEDRQAVLDALRTSESGGGDFHIEYRVCWPDNSTHTIVSHGTPVFSAAPGVTRMVGVNLNATERRLAEAALRQAEKLAAVGRLASTIAHEVNNPLESVTNLLYLARRAEDLPPSVEDYLDTAERELRRVSAIMQQTLRFHRQATRPRLTDSSELFASVLSLHQGRLVNARIEVYRRDRPAPPIVCYEGEIRQLLNSLVGNAVDAMHPSGGVLHLRSREATHWPTGRRGLLFTVADSGPGMPLEVRRRLFDAFFTTKGIGGTGLGLWVSREIAERHAGRLRFRSSPAPGPRRGATFTLFLPYEAAGR